MWYSDWITKIEIDVILFHRNRHAAFCPLHLCQDGHIPGDVILILDFAQCLRVKSLEVKC